MFTWIGNQFETILSNYVIRVVSNLMTGLVPIALTALTLWIIFYGWAVLRGEASDSVPTFVWKIFKISLIMILSLESSIYLSDIAETANSLATGVASTFLPDTANATQISSPYAIIDSFNDKASQLVLDLLKEATIIRLDLVFATIVTSFGNVLFLCVALFVVTMSKVLLTFVLAIGPIFVLSLAWKPTVRFFDSWLSMLLNTVVLTWFALFALGLSANMGDVIVQTVQDHGGFLGTQFNVVAESMKYCVIMILMAIICFQAPSLAAALTGGAVVQMGVQMIQNALIAGGLRSRPKPDIGGAAGGSIRGGAGLPYAAGGATGAAVRNVRQAIPAYKRAIERYRK